MVTELELAWAAGLFDGEGTIGLYSGKSNKCSKGKTWTYAWRLQLCVSMTSKQTIDRLARIMQVGSVLSHSRKGAKPHWKQQWSWRTYASNSEVALRMLMPYLFLKHDQALVAFEFMETCRTRYHQGKPTPQAVHDKRHELAATMKGLKLVG